MSEKKSTPSTKNAKGFEESLWDAANKLRGSVESSEYKHVVLSLIFLKFVSDKFLARRAELVDEGKPLIDHCAISPGLSAQVTEIIPKNTPDGDKVSDHAGVVQEIS